VGLQCGARSPLKRQYAHLHPPVSTEVKKGKREVMRGTQAVVIGEQHRSPLPSANGVLMFDFSLFPYFWRSRLILLAISPLLVPSRWGKRSLD
jgi:hypothetical protein